MFIVLLFFWETEPIRYIKKRFIILKSIQMQKQWSMSKTEKIKYEKFIIASSPFLYPITSKKDWLFHFQLKNLENLVV